MGRMALLYRLVLRPLFREPGRALVILFAVALGDAAVVAIDLAGDAAAGSFHSSMETLAGKDDFEVTAAGGVPEAIVARITRLPYALRISPRIEDHATIAATGQTVPETVPLIGVDLVAEANNADGIIRDATRRDATGVDATSNEGFPHINDPDAVWVTRGLEKAVGDSVQLLINDHARAYVVRGVIPDSAKMGTDAILMDIGAAQMATGKFGRVDRILIKTPDSNNFEMWQSKLQQALPAGVLLNAQGAETAANRRMLAAFRWNLRMLSGIALLVGAFLIYNAVSVSVVRRRSDIGIMRALGASRGAVTGAFLLEAGLFGTLGSVAALPLGRLLAAGAVGMLSTTVNALYISSRPGAMTLSTGTVVVAFVAGIGVALASALAPAREASMVPPTEAMARGRREFEVRVERKRDAWIALMLAVLGAVAALAPPIGGKPLLGYLSALLFVVSAAMLAPLVVHHATLTGSGTGSMGLRRALGVEALLASRSLGGSLRRTSVLVGALATAIAMMTSVGIMVGSFRQTVLTWLDSELPADLYLAPAGATGGDLHPTIAPEVADRIAAIPGVESVSRLRAYEIQYQGLPASLAGASRDRSALRQNLPFLSRRPSRDVLRELAAGNNAVVSEPFANKHHVKAGDTITLPLGEQRVPFRVIDIFYDYGHEAGYIVLDWGTLLRYLPDSAPTNLAVYLAPGTDLERTRAAIQKAIANKSLMMLSNGEIRRQAIRVFDQTFAITYAVEAISILVAIGGISGALISIVMDRRREFGVLRYLGGTSAQIRKLILVEAGLIGILANILGLALGYVLSLVLVYVINKQSFGWTIQFHWPVAVLLVSLSVVYVATVLAGLFPARLAVRLDPMEVVHEE
jgi:putative ABC transport system permease protein